jgi:phosphoenolpyruvate synthase/pyruvate phosphate dikinase
MFILADPSKAFRFSFYPNEGVGLLRMEFIISNEIRIHPMALADVDKRRDSNDKKSIAAITQQYPDKKKYFIEKLSESVAMVAAAFYPKDVIVRMSDFKSNEYAQLNGGKVFEPEQIDFYQNWTPDDIMNRGDFRYIKSENPQYSGKPVFKEERKKWVDRLDFPGRQGPRRHAPPEEG